MRCLSETNKNEWLDSLSDLINWINYHFDDPGDRRELVFVVCVCFFFFVFFFCFVLFFVFVFRNADRQGTLAEVASN